jgi:hypothetical protein
LAGMNVLCPMFLHCNKQMQPAAAPQILGRA